MSRRPSEIKTKLRKRAAFASSPGVTAPPTRRVPAKFRMGQDDGHRVLVTETTRTTCSKLAAEYGIPWPCTTTPRPGPPEKVLEACKDKGKLLGSCSDTGHWMRANLKPVDGLKKLEGRVQHLHFKDLNEFGNGHDVVWGTGKGDVPGILAELKRQGYKGYMSIEFEYGDLEHLDTNLPKCVAFFDKTCAELAK